MWLQIETSILNEETGDVPEDLDGKALLGLEDVCDIIVLKQKYNSFIVGLLEHPAEDEEGEGIILGASNPWEGSDRDYEYEEVC